MGPPPGWIIVPHHGHGALSGASHRGLLEEPDRDEPRHKETAVEMCSGVQRRGWEGRPHDSLWTQSPGKISIWNRVEGRPWISQDLHGASTAAACSLLAVTASIAP